MKFKIEGALKKYNTPEDVADIVRDILAVKGSIEILECSLTTFSPAAFSCLCEAVKQIENLRHLHFESFLDTLTFDEMVEVMKTLSDALPENLQILELPDNALSCNFPEEFGEYLSHASLKELNLHNCGLGERGLTRLTGYLSKVADKSLLVSLVISKNRINKIPKAFDELFSSFPNIRIFKLRNNTIEDESMARFLASITSTQLEILDLSDNFLCEAVPKALGMLFQRLDLKELYLKDAKMDSEEFLIFTDLAKAKLHDTLPGALPTAKPLLTLDISCNDFEQTVACALETLTEIYSFCDLVLYDNCFEDITRLKQLVDEDCGMVTDVDPNDTYNVEDEPAGDALTERMKTL